MTSALPDSPTAPGARAALAGVLTLVSLIAFEAIAIATAMPVVAADLGGLREYGLAFSLFLTTSLFGMVLAGGWNDARGPRAPMLAGLVLFAAGLVLCGLATTFTALLAGRVVAGVGGGLLVVTMYVVIALVWAEQARPRVFAWVSSAWVVPSLVGPPLAGWLAEDVDWRLVFLLVPPLAVVASLLLRRALAASTAPPPRTGGRREGRRLVLGGALAGGAVLVQWGATSLVPPRPLPLAALALGLVLVALSLPQLLPPGTLRAARGLPSVVGARGLYTACFAGAEAYMPLMLVTQRGLTPTAAGFTLTGGALGWALGSYLQGRPGLRVPRHRLMAFSGLLVGAAVATLAVPALGLLPALVVLPAWALAGFGMGLALASTSVLVLGMSAPEVRGRNSSALQLSDALGSVAGILVGGALLAAGTGTGAAGEDAAQVASGGTFALIFACLALAGVAAAVFGARVRPPRSAPGDRDGATRAARLA